MGVAALAPIAAAIIVHFIFASFTRSRRAARGALAGACRPPLASLNQQLSLIIYSTVKRLFNESTFERSRVVVLPLYLLLLLHK